MVESNGSGNSSGNGGSDSDGNGNGNDDANGGVDGVGDDENLTLIPTVKMMLNELPDMVCFH